jgi:Tol biopolymer transport system component
MDSKMQIDRINALLVACLLLTAATSKAQSPRIAFESNRDGNGEIYSMNPDGSDSSRLTQNTAVDSAPHWSPDGRQIAYHSDRNGSFDIFVMNEDGSGDSQLTDSVDLEGQPEWSPNGTEIVYVRWPAGGIPDINLMDADGSNVRQVGVQGVEPTWSPDGRRILFQSIDDDLYVVDKDGSNLQQLTDDPEIDEAARWSPDGTLIVFESARDGNNEIYVMDPDGGNVTRITNNLATDEGPTWSPEGQRIAFASDRSGNMEIFSVPLSGGSPNRLTNQSGEDEFPAWKSGFDINQGIAASWFDAATSGQGFLIDLNPVTQFMFVAWFTFEKESGKLGSPTQRWLVASGNYSGGHAELPIFVVSGGLFDDPAPVTSQQDGTIAVSFSDCENGLVLYDLASENLAGHIPITRALPGTGELCEALAEPVQRQ